MGNCLHNWPEPNSWHRLHDAKPKEQLDPVERISHVSGPRLMGSILRPSLMTLTAYTGFLPGQYGVVSPQWFQTYVTFQGRFRQLLSRFCTLQASGWALS